MSPSPLDAPPLRSSGQLAPEAEGGLLQGEPGGWDRVLNESPAGLRPFMYPEQKKETKSNPAVASSVSHQNGFRWVRSPVTTCLFSSLSPLVPPPHLPLRTLGPENCLPDVPWRVSECIWTKVSHMSEAGWSRVCGHSLGALGTPTCPVAAAGRASRPAQSPGQRRPGNAFPGHAAHGAKTETDGHHGRSAACRARCLPQAAPAVTPASPVD